MKPWTDSVADFLYVVELEVSCYSQWFSESPGHPNGRERNEDFPRKTGLSLMKTCGQQSIKREVHGASVFGTVVFCEGFVSGM